MSLGKRIRELRLGADMTLEELAEKAGSTKQYLGDIENGKKNNPSAKLLLNIAKVLNTTVDYLLTGNPNIKLPDVSNLDVELQKIFYELVQDPNSKTMFRKNEVLGKEELESILSFIAFTKQRAKEKRKEEEGI